MSSSAHAQCSDAAVCVCVFVSGTIWQRSGTGRARAIRDRGFPGVTERITGRAAVRITARPAVVMSEEAVRQTRRQKRALEREAPPLDDEAPPLDSKRIKMDAGEVKATFKLEVQTRGGPMDASASHTEMKRVRRSPSPDDVIVLSDEAPSPRVNGRNLNTDLLMRSSAEHRERVIKQLKEELRLEEVKLILLKKIRHSQEHKDSSGQKPEVTRPTVRDEV
ncbi:transcriptional repressor p66-alpha-like [Pseudorasbora parva]|uniref:transcriptional repressor p66-alpha-like n=1 Tax=Pseudorasbora parva TaxID=51549 RepID=UPI00351F65D4